MTPEQQQALEEFLRQINPVNQTDVNVASGFPPGAIERFNNTVRPASSMVNPTDAPLHNAGGGGLLDVLNSSNFQSWMFPLEGTSRAMGAMVSRTNPLAAASSPNAPLFGQTLVERGAPEWAGALAEFLVPDPTGAKKAKDLIPLLGFIAPAILRRFNLGRTGDELVEFVRANQGTAAPDTLFEQGLENLANLKGGKITKSGPNDLVFDAASGRYLGFAEVKLNGVNISLSQTPQRPNTWSIHSLESTLPVGDKEFIDAMDGLTRLADASGINLVGSPLSYGSQRLQTNQLFDMYNKMGFELMNAQDGIMIRRPLPLDESQRIAEVAARKLNYDFDAMTGSMLNSKIDSKLSRDLTSFFKTSHPESLDFINLGNLSLDEEMYAFSWLSENLPGLRAQMRGEIPQNALASKFKELEEFAPSVYESPEFWYLIENNLLQVTPDAVFDLNTMRYPIGKLPAASFVGTDLGKIASSNADFMPPSVLQEASGNPLRMSPDELSQLANDIMKNPAGVSDPVKISYDPKAMVWWVGEGNHRAAAAAQAGVPGIPTVVLRDTVPSQASQINLQPIPQRGQDFINRSRAERHGYVPSTLAPSDLGLPIAERNLIETSARAHAQALQLSDAELDEIMRQINNMYQKISSGGMQ